MSDADHRARAWHCYIRDMLAFGEKVLAYTTNMEQSEFISDERTYDATLRNLELIGEAAVHVPIDIREAHPGIPWRAVIGTRNRLAHGYLGIDDDVIWDIVRTDVPELCRALRNLSGTVQAERG